MRIAVTGASEFIGKNVVNHLLKKGHKVISVGGPDPKINGVEHKAWGLQKKVNIIVHCAAEHDDWTSAEEGELLKNANLLLTDNALKINPKARFIFMSSSAVYQSSEGDFAPVEELIENDTSMLNLYSVSKAVSEHMVAQQKEDGRYYILRPRAVYGAGEEVLMPRLEEYAKGYFILPGKNPMGSLTNIKTLCEVVEFFVDDVKGEHSGIYNVADGEAENMHDLVVSFSNLRGHSAKPMRLPYSIAYKSVTGLENKAKKNGTIPMATRYIVSLIGRDSVMNVEKLEAAMGKKLPKTDISDAADW